MIELLLQGLLACIMLPDYDEFGECIDNVVLEYNILQWETNAINSMTR